MSCKTRKILKSPWNTADGSEILHQLIVYPIIYIVLYIRGGAEFLPSTVVCPCNTLVNVTNLAVAIENGPFEDLEEHGGRYTIRRVDCPICVHEKHGDIPASYVSLAEGSLFWVLCLLLTSKCKSWQKNCAVFKDRAFEEMAHDLDDLSGVAKWL